MIKRFLRTSLSYVRFIVLVLLIVCFMFVGVGMFVAGLTGIYMGLRIGYYTTLWKYVVLVLAGVIGFAAGLALSFYVSTDPIL